MSLKEVPINQARLVSLDRASQLSAWRAASTAGQMFRRVVANILSVTTQTTRNSGRVRLDFILLQACKAGVKALREHFSSARSGQGEGVGRA